MGSMSDLDVKLQETASFLVQSLGLEPMTAAYHAAYTVVVADLRATMDKAMAFANKVHDEALDQANHEDEMAERHAVERGVG